MVKHKTFGSVEALNEYLRKSPPIRIISIQTKTETHFTKPLSSGLGTSKDVVEVIQMWYEEQDPERVLPKFPKYDK